MNISVTENIMVDATNTMEQTRPVEKVTTMDLINIGENVHTNKIIAQLSKITKRTVDILGGIAGVLLLVPMTIVLYIAKLVTKEKGPLFYSQQRIGKDGKLFKMYKYRSMVVNADEILKKHLEENEEARKEYKKYKKLKNDPRITKLGNFIRKTSIDEFPQFINVLKGEMSLVGPRPYLPREKEEMGKYYKYITKCKPGITGYWQVNGRSAVTFNDRLDMDFKYYNKKSLKTDLKLLKKTVQKVLVKEGAI